MNRYDGSRIDDLTRGYTVEGGRYVCMECGKSFAPDEVYPAEGRFFTAERAAQEHAAEHGSRLTLLLADKYASLTEVQKRLLALFGEGLTDAEVAMRLNLSPSTVRSQKFQFRERAKQAQVYLAAYGLALGGRDGLMPVPDKARMVDERFAVTDAERDKILAAAFSSENPLTLTAFPAKEKKKVVILTRIAQEFSRGRVYTEKEVNGILSGIYPDYATIRRYLVEYGFLDRKIDCSEYWVK